MRSCPALRLQSRGVRVKRGGRGARQGACAPCREDEEAPPASPSGSCKMSPAMTAGRSCSIDPPTTAVRPWRQVREGDNTVWHGEEQQKGVGGEGRKDAPLGQGGRGAGGARGEGCSKRASFLRRHACTCMYACVLEVQSRALRDCSPTDRGPVIFLQRARIKSGAGTPFFAGTNCRRVL